MKQEENNTIKYTSIRISDEINMKLEHIQTVIKNTQKIKLSKEKVIERALNTLLLYDNEVWDEHRILTYNIERGRLSELYGK